MVVVADPTGTLSRRMLTEVSMIGVPSGCIVAVPQILSISFGFASYLSSSTVMSILLTVKFVWFSPSIPYGLTAYALRVWAPIDVGAVTVVT